MNPIKLFISILTITLGIQIGNSQDMNSSNEIAQTNKEIVSRFYDEVFINWDRNLVEETLDAEFRSHDWPEDSKTGVDGFYEFYNPVLKSFPDTRYTVNDLISEGDKVVVYWTLFGTQKGEFMGIPPTNVEIEMNGIAIYRLENEKMLERWVVYDLFSLVAQIKNASDID
jgi:predicted ester cyclase